MHFYWNFVKLLLLLRPLIGKSQDNLTNAELVKKSIELREALVAMGATFVKLGQILSMRYDFLHKITCEELQKLLDEQATVMTFKEVEHHLKTEFGKDAQLLKSISQQPIAVASLAQVHTAYLANSDQKLALKIQKPLVREQIESDIAAINNSLYFLKLIPGNYRFTLEEILKEFAEWTLKELDFTLEAANIERFDQLFQKESEIVPLMVFRKFTNNKILTTNFIEGVSARKIMQASRDATLDEISCDGDKFSRKKIIHTIEKAVYNQIFKTGFIHGDPHPSNMILTDQNHVAFLDFGIALQLNNSQQNWFKETVYHIATNQQEEVVRDLIKMDERPGHATDEEINAKTMPILNKLETSLNEEFSSSEFLIQLLNICMSLEIQIPRFIVMLAKAIATYDGIVQTIKPDSNLMRELLPFFEADGSDQLLSIPDIKQQALKSIKTTKDLINLATELPGEALGLVKDLRENGIKISDSSSDNKVKVEAETQIHKHEIVTIIFLNIAVLVSFFGILTMLGQNSIITWSMLALSIMVVLFSLYYLIKK